MLAAWRRLYFILGIFLYLSVWLLQLNQYLEARKLLLQQHSSVIANVQGRIVGSPKHFPQYSQFLLQLEDGVAKDYRLQLSWSTPSELPQAGQRWQFSIKLRPITGVANPAAIHREALAMLDGVLLQGSVQTEPAALKLDANTALRQQRITEIQQATAAFESAPLLMALTVGEKRFSAELWQGLQQSALSHLLAISGLHIGLVFGWSLWLLQGCGLREGRMVIRLALYGVSLAVALLYAWLSGFAIPTVRAAVALMILVLCKVQLRSFSYAQYWLLLTAVLLLVEPLLVLSKSFWLSLSAVAVIFMLLWRSPPQQPGWRNKLLLFFRFHCFISVAMTLLSLLLFDGSSVLALLSNVVFVPWVSLIAIPVLMLTLLWQLLYLPGAAILWQLSDWLFRPLLKWLLWCSSQQGWWALPDVHWLSMVTLALALTLCWFNRHRLFIGLLAIAAVITGSVVAAAPYWQLHVIDVGQGLSVLLQHGSRGLLYDAGPRYGDSSATASSVLPYLRQRGIRQLDYLILSHDDSDHTGDYSLLIKHYPTSKIISDIGGIPDAVRCSQLPEPYLDTQLQMLTIASPLLSTKNDQSCVLLINVDGWHILLPGDISQHAERLLLKQYPALSADVLLLAHHGSASSSQFDFLFQLSPLLALNSASLYNRHQHPSTEVLQRLSLLRIPMLNTASSGAIRLDISPQQLVIRRYRQERIPLWLQNADRNAETLQTTR